jgi:two-component system chemotaxis sensor kinase CheA
MKKRQRPSVLVVDDDADICQALRWLLQDEGYEVLWTLDGASALNILRSTDVRFVVLLDYLMPEVSGDTVLETVAAEPTLKRRHTFILMTAVARTFPVRMRRLLQALAVPVVHKPFDIDELAAKVSQAAQALPVQA